MGQMQSVNTGDSPQVVILSVEGDFRVVGWDRNEVLARADEDVTLKQDGNNVYLTTSSGCALRVPVKASLQVDKVEGDTRIKSVEGQLVFQNVSGDLALRHTGPVRIVNATGDVSAKHVNGDFNAENVHGDLIVLAVQGEATVGTTHGSLRVVDTAGVKVDMVYGDVTTQATRGPVSITKGGSDVRVQEVQGSATIDHAGGDLSVQRVQGPVVINEAGGDLMVQGVQGPVTIDKVSGSVRVEGVQGPVVLESSGGDVSAGGIQSFNADHIGGDLTLHSAQGAVDATADGDAVVSFTMVAGQTYRISAKGDIACRVPPDANADVHITSGSKEIVLNLPGGNQSLEQEAHDVKLGEGGVTVTLAADGNVALTTGPSGHHEKHGDFTQSVNMGDFRFDLDDVFDQPWGDIGGKIAQRAAAAAQRATARVQAKVQADVQRAVHKAQSEARRAERQVRMGTRHMDFDTGPEFGHHRGWRMDRTPTPPTPPGEPVTEQERMAVLKMLEDKKITADQAARLLAALEGKNP